MKTCLFVLVVLCSGIAQATVVEWLVSEGGNGHFYEVVLDSVAWYEARDGAYASGGYLASITSAEENAFVFALVEDRSLWFGDTHPGASYIGPWLGGYQPEGSEEPAGGWRWVTDEPFDYTIWSDGQPSNTGDTGEHRLHFLGHDSLMLPLWNDFRGSAYVSGYVVEYVPEPATLLLFGLGCVFVRRLKRP